MTTTKRADGRYDLVHIRAQPWRSQPPRTAALLDLAFEPMGLSLSLEAARARRQALDRHGITVLVVPVRYRTPKIGPDEARRLAAAFMDGEGKETRRGEPLLIAEHPMYYAFREDAAPRPAGEPPAVSTVLVDRCDGHVRSAEEEVDLFARIGPRQP